MDMWKRRRSRTSWPRGTVRIKYFEVLMGVALKTMSNYLDHISPTELDPAFRSEG